MKTYRKLITAAVLMLSLCSSMQAQIITRRKTLQDNERLRATVDSLRRQLDSCRMQLARFDSLASEMMEVYEDEKVVVTQEQTELSTDSLLSIWYLQRRMNSMPDTEIGRASCRERV